MNHARGKLICLSFVSIENDNTKSLSDKEAIQEYAAKIGEVH